MMKSAFRCVQIVLLLFGVFGADEDEVKPVSVMEGDSVTLNPDLTQIKKFNLLEWRFGDPVIAQTDGKTILYPSDSEIFRDRLQLDLTGSLSIKNMKTKHSGLYDLQISHGAGTKYGKFNVTVYESASVAGKSEMKSVSLMEGDRVTLQTDVTLYGDELIVWRFGDEGEVIAKADIEAKSSPLYDTEERFRGRLELENKTGSLIITNTRTSDSGHYTVKISSRAQTVNKRFTVTISGFPNVIGAIDCTHIHIKAPPGPNEGDFVNRKGVHSINVQMVCDSMCHITNVEAKWPGSVHDSRIFRESHLCTLFERGDYDGILVGDRGYACRQYFMTPFPDPNPGPQTRYNAALARTRARIEMTFGQLKGRFQCLKSLRVAPDRACDIIVACAVLHNIATIRKERTPVVEVQPDDDLQPVHLDQPSGRAARNRIVEHHF